MFLLRSIFWLSVAFVVIRPGVDVDTAARTMSARAVEVGQQVVVDQVLDRSCSDLQCRGGKAIETILATTAPTAGSTMQDPAAGPAPIPRPRPDRKG